MSQDAGTGQNVERVHVDYQSVYMDYLHEANKVFKVQRQAYIPYMAIGLVGFLIGGAACYLGLFVSSSLGDAGVRTASWIFWICLIVSTIVGLVGASKAKNRAFKEAADVAAARPGFVEFFKLYYTRRYWPKQMVTGKKYEEFLAIIGHK